MSTWTTAASAFPGEGLHAGDGVHRLVQRAPGLPRRGKIAGIDAMCLCSAELRWPEATLPVRCQMRSVIWVNCVKRFMTDIWYISASNEWSLSWQSEKPKPDHRPSAPLQKPGHRRKRAGFTAVASGGGFTRLATTSGTFPNCAICWRWRRHEQEIRPANPR